VSLRDRLSLGIARELCLRDDYRLTRDPVLALGEVLRPDVVVPVRKGRVAVAPRPWSPSGEKEGLSFWEGLLEGLVQQGLEPILVAFDPRMDVDFCEQLRSSLALREVRTWNPAQGFVGAGAVFDGCEMVFGMRFHALILALLLGKPMLAFSYDEKVTGLMADLGLSSLCHELSGDVPAALDFVRQGRQYLADRKPEVQSVMRDYVSESQSLTTKDFGRIMDSL